MAPQHVRDSKLERLSDTDLILADQSQDIRDRKVIDRHGEEIGHVADLFIDEVDRNVRMLVIRAGGFLGLGERHFLLPVDAVTDVTNDEVHVNVTLERVIGSPAYDPRLIDAPPLDAWGPYYGYYGLPPYWGAGYIYPGLPMSRNSIPRDRFIR